MADLGYLALFLALVASLYAFLAYLFAARGRANLLHSARASLTANCILLSLSVFVLALALIFHDFSIDYVARYSSRATSLPYLISALWAGNKGSLLFWAWALSVFAAIAVRKQERSDRSLVPYAAGIMMFTQVFFLVLLVSISNPFLKLTAPVSDGAGMNPMLENIGMIIHPPALLAGYVGLTVPFAMGLAALMSGRLDNQWLVSVRRWTLVPWLLLGAGNIIGAWWAYVELGWGGYWAWDPVENAGLIPWLVTTAFLHSIIMQRRRGMFKVWNLVLVILAFNLAVFGTFLTRSNILSSVHTFGDTGLVPFFMSFLAITFIIPLVLLYRRRNSLKSETEVDSLVTREGTFLVNNLLLMGVVVVTFLGTMFPAISEGLSGSKVEVGAGFFNTVNGPLFLAIIVLAGVCTLIGWQRVPAPTLAKRLILPVATGLVLGVVLGISGLRDSYPVIAFSLCAFVLAGIGYSWWREAGGRANMSRARAFWSLLRDNRPRYGGYIVHIGILLIAIGVIGSTFYATETDVTLQRGESVQVGKYTLTYDKIVHFDTPDKLVFAASMSITNSGQPFGVAVPERYFHRSYDQPVSEVSINSRPLEDVYVVLLDVRTDASATFKIMVNPMVSWIWVGGGVLVLGGLVAFLSRRQQPAPAPTTRKEKRT